MFGKGISREGDILDLAAEEDVINKSGSWYSYKDIKIGQGRENAKAFLLENPDIFYDVEKQVRENHNLSTEGMILPVMEEVEEDKSVDAEAEADKKK